MDLLSKSMIAAVAIIIVMSLVYYALSGVQQPPKTESDVIQLVTNDILKNYPGADVQVLSAAQPSAGIWNLNVSVVLNATSPCPTYFISTYEYPSYHFVSGTQNVYTDNCTVFGNVTNNYTAVVKSYQFGVSNVTSYVSKYGYSSVSTHATPYTSYSANDKTYTDVWLVDYSAPQADYTVHVLLSQGSGTLLATYTTAN